MQDASGSISEAEQQISNNTGLYLQKSRSYTRCLVGICVCIWMTSFLSYLGAEWLHTRQQPEYIKVVPRPPHAITTTLRGSGAVSALVGVLGWWGVLHERYGCIVTFSIITFLSSILDISCGSVTISYVGKTTLLMEEDVARNLNRVTNASANQTTDNFLALQVTINCCGISSYHDWINSSWWQSQRDLNSSLVIPDSCCNKESTQRCNVGKPPYLEVDFPSSVYKVGCMKKISEYMDHLFHTTGFLAFVGGVMKLIGFFLLHVTGNIILYYRQQSEAVAPE